MRHRSIALLAVLVTAAVASVAGASTKDVRLSLVAYSTPAGAFTKMIPDFRRRPVGTTSRSGSPTVRPARRRCGPDGSAGGRRQASLAPDVTVLSQAGLIKDHLEQGSVRRHGHRLDRGVRRPPGQSEGHQDLGRPDQAGHPGHQPQPVHLGRRALERHGRVGRADQAEEDREEQANAYLGALYKNITVQDSSARASMKTLVAGSGDVLLAYENEALFARSRGQGSPFVIPRSTILIENPIAVLRKSEHKQEANAFLRFLRTPEAQKTFAENGYRPVSKAVAKQFTSKFPARPGQSRSTSLGSAAGTRCRSGSSTRAPGSWHASRGRSEVSPAEHRPGVS